MENIDNFFDLLEHYKRKEFRDFIRDKNGVIKIYLSGFNSGNGFYMNKDKKFIIENDYVSKGYYICGLFISTDGKKYFKKASMNAKHKMFRYEHNEQARFNGVIAHEVFDYFGVRSAKYLPAIEKAPYYYLISENFLENNQEMITLNDLELEKEKPNEYETHFDVMTLIEKNIKYRYKKLMGEEKYRKLEDKLRLQYYKQAFIKRIIGLKDEKLDNNGIVLTTTGVEMDLPEIDIAPAFDLDLSFNFGNDTKMIVLKAQNKKTDMNSIINEFVEIKGFKEFLKTVYDKIKDEDQAIETIIENSYNASKANYFKNPEDVERYREFLKEKFTQIKQVYIGLNKENSEKGEEERC